VAFTPFAGRRRVTARDRLEDVVSRWDETLAPGTGRLASAPPPPLRRGATSTIPWPRSRRAAPGTTGAASAPTVLRPLGTRRRQRSAAVAAVAIAVDTVVAAGQGWAMRSGGDCASLPCSVATLGGHPALCLAMALTGLLALFGAEVAAPLARHHPQSETLRETIRAGGMALSVVATAGAIAVAALAIAAAMILVVVLVSGARVLGQR